MNKFIILLGLQFLTLNSIALTDQEILDLEQKLAYAFVGAKWEKSIEIANELLKYRPHNPNVHFDKALGLLRLGRHKEAIESYNLTLKYKDNPVKDWRHYNLGMIYYDLAQCYEGLEEYEEALRLYRLSAKHGRHDRYVDYGIGEMLYKLDRLDKEPYYP